MPSLPGINVVGDLTPAGIESELRGALGGRVGTTLTYPLVSIVASVSGGADVQGMARQARREAHIASVSLLGAVTRRLHGAGEAEFRLSFDAESGVVTAHEVVAASGTANFYSIVSDGLSRFGNAYLERFAEVFMRLYYAGILRRFFLLSARVFSPLGPTRVNASGSITTATIRL